MLEKAYRCATPFVAVFYRTATEDVKSSWKVLSNPVDRWLRVVAVGKAEGFQVVYKVGY